MVLILLTILALGAAAVLAMVAWRVVHTERRRALARVAALSAAIDVDPAAPIIAPVAIDGLFEERATAPGATPWLVKGGAVLALGVVLLGLVTWQQTRTTAPAAAAKGTRAPLELVSMRHTRDAAGLTVTGLVRNPSAGAPVSQLMAVVMAFDRDGRFSTSNRAPVEFGTLEPGDSSPFSVTIRDAADIGRYTVAFRTDAGILRHVDRRSDTLKVAANGR